MFRRLLKYGADVGPGFASLRCALTAGEKLPDAVRAEWEAATGAPLYEALGMSECSTYISSGPEVPVRAGFSGRPQRGRRVAILPEAGDAPILMADAGPYFTVLDFALTVVITLCGVVNLLMVLRWQDFLGGEWRRYLLVSAMSVAAAILFVWTPDAV